VSNLLVRSLTGTAFVAVMVAAAWAGPLTTLLLFLPITALAAREWHRLVAHMDTASRSARAVAVPVLAYCAIGVVPLLPAGQAWWPIALLLMVLFALIATDLFRDPSRIVDLLAQRLLAIALIAFPMACAVWLAVHTWVFLGFLIVLWSNDTGAFLAGKAIGRHKLLPMVSPGKTWEGLAGGSLFAIAAAWAVAQWLDPQWPFAVWLCASIVVAIASTIGDLLESAVKRAAGAKDSGTLLPGHGGVLDRFDGYLLAAPAMLVILHVVGHHGP
jgi:phosphatidate cytidylyltransferase